MSGGGGKVFPLQGNQRIAADPRENVWLSASAGTGKTQVLSARVLRLLLRPEVTPDAILCLTFTKAGAAEMANRINAVLARWVRLDPTSLATELSHLGADVDPATLSRARTLFASVLDCPGGGLRIDTIHAFAQYLLANFPGEADLQPGARPMEDRERELLAREVLSDMLSTAEAQGDHALLAAVETFVRAKSPDDLRQWLMHCARHEGLWLGPNGWQPPMRGRVIAMLGMPADADAGWVEQALDPAVFPDQQLERMLPTLRDWNAKGGREGAAFVKQWLASSTTDRTALLDGFMGTLLTKKGEPKSMPTPEKVDPDFKLRQQELADAVALLAERQAMLDLVELLVPALELGRAFALRWGEAKAREGLLDFDDLIERAAALLGNSDAADWIRYKLDRRFDHILIDEAQDTNAAQWDIVFALIDDFFTGEGASGKTLRTIFTVGDYKQAIFGFQGTSPENFASAREKVREQILQAREGALEARERGPIPDWKGLELGQSFRTADVVLQFVNRAIDALGADAFGLDTAPEEHHGAERPGLVTLWNPVVGEQRDAADEDQQDWLADHERTMADRIAEQVWRWHSGAEPLVLAKEGEPRAATAGDVMVLVRKRGALAALIVARLHAKGVPVAGVDRLRLGAPLAVKDLMAAIRFASQPLDDLNLANLLASPLLGWSQDDLLEFVPRPKGARLWHHLRDHHEPRVIETVGRLRDLLARADFDTPHATLSWLLVGSWQGRKNLVTRLGSEANDSIDELLNSALAYEAVSTPSLAGFIEWFDASDAELKREAGETSDQVQVMTVHGSKGLQAPIVILADASGSPRAGGVDAIEETSIGQSSSQKVPLPRLAKQEKLGPLRAADEAASELEMQEHWRLLYVAMTRAEESLFIGGSLSAQQAKKGPPEESWYAQLAPLFDSDPLEDDIWGGRHEWGYRAESKVLERSKAAAETIELPDWAVQPVGVEPRPPRPLAPSAAGEDLAADPPLKPEAAQLAARRGVLIHQLLERLPALAEERREAAAQKWLARHAQEIEPAQRDEMISSALSVLANPNFAGIFAPEALSEVPLAAVVDGQVITGTVDRLLVEPNQITVVDFKTSRRPPEAVEEIPTATLKQMAAYSAALATIYPDKPIRVAVLYTHAPQLFDLPSELLEQHKLRLSGTQESYSV